jgi:hypothetical protein
MLATHDPPITAVDLRICPWLVAAGREVADAVGTATSTLASEGADATEVMR